MISPAEIGTAYETLDMKNRISFTFEQQRFFENAASLEFERIHTERFVYNAQYANENERFDKVFLLGIVQSSLFEDDREVALTTSKKLFLPESLDCSSDILIAIVNYRNGNIYIGPNNGLGSSFSKGFPTETIKVFSINKEILVTIKNECNNETALAIIENQPKFDGSLVEVDFLGEEKDLTLDSLGRPKSLTAKIWIDLYGNIKTTVPSGILNEVKQFQGNVNVVINGVTREVFFAETFSQVPVEQLFMYNGSTGSIGLNPHRSKRYVELTANGIYGKFGIDFFEKNGTKPLSGDVIHLEFEYPDNH